MGQNLSSHVNHIPYRLESIHKGNLSIVDFNLNAGILLWNILFYQWIIGNNHQGFHSFSPFQNTKTGARENSRIPCFTRSRVPSTLILLPERFIVRNNLPLRWLSLSLHVPYSWCFDSILTVIMEYFNKIKLYIIFFYKYFLQYISILELFPSCFFLEYHRLFFLFKIYIASFFSIEFLLFLLRLSSYLFLYFFFLS